MNREKEIFEAALELNSPEERAAYLKGACSGDEELRVVVEELIGAHFDAGDFLPTVPHGEMPAIEGEGSLVGRYKLLQKIGEGGFGVVYMAEQKEPVRRRLALKIIKPGMDTKQVIARFEAERQALAMMDHPNIARVLDGGSTGDGRPYFVMDLVKGLPITEYCDAEKLSARRRMELMVEVCYAVQHAHQKGVIHRDLKPANVLVAPYDGRPVPMIIDFGIAKALQQPLTEHTLFTGFNQMIGTPAYMSPEQAEMNALDVDTRADIYTLGVMFYELLTGVLPIDPRRLREAGFDEMQRLIREEPAERPSTRIRTLERTQQTRIANQRQDDPARLGKTFSGEVDWIVLKALEKERGRRYDSAAALGDDIKRYLEGDAVEACPPNTLYLIQKFVRKHRSPFVVAGLLMLALLLGAILSTHQAMRASRAEAATLDQLWKSYLVQARSIRSTEQPGRQFDSLAAIGEAAKIRPSAELRNEAVAALALADLRPLELIDPRGGLEPEDGYVLDVEGGRYALPRPGDGTIGIHRIEGEEELFRLPASPGEIHTARFSTSGRYLAAVDERLGKFTVWDLQGPEQLKVLEDLPWAFASFSPDDRYLAIRVENRKGIRIYDLKAGSQIHEIDCGAEVRDAIFSPDSNHIALPAKSTRLSIFDVSSGSEIQSFEQSTSFMSAAWHPGGEFFATGDASFGIQIWDLSSGEVVNEFRGHEAEVSVLAFHPGGQFLFSSGWDGQTRVWNFHRGYSVLKVAGTIERLSTDGARVGFRLNRAGAGIWQFSGGTPSLHHFRLKGRPGDKVSSLSFSADGRWLATTRSGLSLWDMGTGQLAAESTEVASPRDVSFDVTGTDLFVGGRSGLNRLSLRSVIDDRGTSRTIFLRGETLLDGRVKRLGLSTDGRRVAAIRGRGLHLIDTSDGVEEKLLAGQPGLEHGDAVFSPDGTWLVGTCWAGRGIRIWNLQEPDGLPVDLLEEQSVVNAAFSRDGRWLLTGTRTAYQFWDTDDWEENLSKRIGRKVVGGRGVMAFHPKEKILAVSLDETSVQLIDLTNDEILVELRPPNPTSLMQLEFSADGTQLAALTAIHDTFVWNLSRLRRELSAMGLDW